MINAKIKTFKSLRRDTKKTALQIAESLGVSIHTYRKYEESTRTPSVDVISKMCSEFGCDYNIIMSAVEYHKIELKNKQKRTRKNKGGRRSEKNTSV